jgi:hypothetical protein
MRTLQLASRSLASFHFRLLTRSRPPKAPTGSAPAVPGWVHAGGHRQPAATKGPLVGLCLLGCSIRELRLAPGENWRHATL